MAQMSVNSEKFDKVSIYSERELLNQLDHLGVEGNGFITFEIDDAFIQSCGDRQNGFSLEKLVGNMIYQAVREDFSVEELKELYINYYHQRPHWDNGVVWEEFLDTTEPMTPVPFLGSPYYKLLYRLLQLAFLLFFASYFIDFKELLKSITQ